MYAGSNTFPSPHVHLSDKWISECEPTQLSLTSQSALRLPTLSQTLSSQKANHWRTNGWTQLLVQAPDIWRLVYCWTTAESVPELGTNWQVKENWFSYQSCRTFCFAVTAESEDGKNICIILGLYSLARRKWGNTETAEWEMNTMFAPPNFKLHFVGLWERLMVA